MLFKARMKKEGKEKQSVFMLLGQLTGLAWEACDSLAEDSDELQETDAFDELIFILDSRLKHDKSTELPDAFEDYFYRSSRKPTETFFDYIARIRLSTNRVLGHKIDLPYEVRGWLLLRRAGLPEEQKTLVMSQIGTNLAFNKVAAVLQTTFGQ